MGRILVIRGGAIGDFILTLPAIQLLRENFPSAELEIIGYKHIVALAEGRGYAEHTRSIEYGPMASFFARNGQLSTELCAYFASFQQVVSYLFDPEGIFEANVKRAGVKNFLPAFRRIDDSAHAAHQLALPLQALALYLEDAAAHVFPSEEDHIAARAALPGVDFSTLLALHVGSGSAQKNWPLERWAELGPLWLREHPGAALLLIGGEADAERLAGLQAAWPHLPVHTAHAWPLPQLAALLQQVRHFTGHDSGISHLAAAVGTPCTLLFGPTDPDIWAPANAAVRIVAAPAGDLAQLEVAEVLRALQSGSGPSRT